MRVPSIENDAVSTERTRPVGDVDGGRPGIGEAGGGASVALIVYTESVGVDDALTQPGTLAVWPPNEPIQQEADAPQPSGGDGAPPPQNCHTVQLGPAVQHAAAHAVGDDAPAVDGVRPQICRPLVL